MPQADLLAILETDSASALLLDRRQRSLAAAARAGSFALDAVWELPGPVGRAPVYAALIRPPEGKVERSDNCPFPKRIAVGDMLYLRLVDRFYLPAAPDPMVSVALFDLIAGAYDRLISPEVNIQTARMLLEAVLPGDSAKAYRILDFGCGTGLALEAASRMDDRLAYLELVGTDASLEMLELAARRGERVLPLEEWRAISDGSFDGAVSTFVLHYGVSCGDRLRIVRQLRPGARFAANCFKANWQAVNVVISEFADAGLVLERIEPLTTTPGSENPMLVFMKSGRTS